MNVSKRTHTIQWVDYLRVIFLLNPVVCFIITWPLNNTEDFMMSFVFAYSISVLTASFCIGFSVLMEMKTTVWMSFTPRKRNIFFQALAMGPALYLAFQITQGLFNTANDSKIEIHFGQLFTQSLSFIVLIMGIGYLLDLIKDLKFEKTQKELLLKKAELENLQIKMNTLTQQLSPHFIFNALNTLSSAIRVNPAVAEKMSLDLADFFRTILEAIKKETHSLEQEINITKNYLEIERIRFGDRISYRFGVNADVNMQFQIPVLILQPLVENAIKHGLQRIKEGGLIQILISQDEHFLICTVSNTLSADSSALGTKTGIANIEKRLEIFYRQPVQIKTHSENNEYRVQFSLPFYNQTKLIL